MQIQPSLYTNTMFGGCDFQFKTKDHHVICGRSLEFPLSNDVKIHTFSQGEVHSSITPDHFKGLEWTTKYGFIGISVLNKNKVDEGMNEVGLSFGFLTLQCSNYQDTQNHENSKILNIMDAGMWILGNFAIVEEVKQALKEVKIWGEMATQINPGLQIALHDALGNNLVIEFLNGKIMTYDNPLGVLTNDPPYEWHLKHIGRYFLTFFSPGPLSDDVADVVTKTGKLTNWCSINRFLRILTIIQSVIQQPNTALEGVNFAAYILNSIDIPNLSQIREVGDQTFYQLRYCHVSKDLKNRRFYFKCYTDLSMKVIDLTTINFKPGIKYNSIHMQTALPILDISMSVNETND